MEGKVAWNFGVANLQSIGITKVTHNLATEQQQQK